MIVVCRLCTSQSILRVSREISISRSAINKPVEMIFAKDSYTIACFVQQASLQKTSLAERGNILKKSMWKTELMFKVLLIYVNMHYAFYDICIYASLNTG